MKDRNYTQVDYSDYPDKDTKCPWCLCRLKQLPQIVACPDCPFTAQYFADLTKNPPYIIHAFADWKETKRENDGG